MLCKAGQMGDLNRNKTWISFFFRKGTVTMKSKPKAADRGCTEPLPGGGPHRSSGITPPHFLLRRRCCLLAALGKLLAGAELIFSGWLANIDFLPQWKRFYSDACHLNSFYTAA